MENILFFFVADSLKLIIIGYYSERGTPVPVPNTEVKPFSVYGTVGLPWWESGS